MQGWCRDESRSNLKVPRLDFDDRNNVPEGESMPLSFYDKGIRPGILCQWACTEGTDGN